MEQLEGSSSGNGGGDEDQDEEDLHWDGHSCKDCLHTTSMSAIVNMGPCPACGWEAAVRTGERFPPGFCASTWRIARKDMETIQKEFPHLSRKVVTAAVIDAGEDDVGGVAARAILSRR